MIEICQKFLLLLLSKHNLTLQQIAALQYNIFSLLKREGKFPTDYVSAGEIKEKC